MTLLLWDRCGDAEYVILILLAAAAVGVLSLLLLLISSEVVLSLVVVPLSSFGEPTSKTLDNCGRRLRFVLTNELPGLCFNIPRKELCEVIESPGASLSFEVK